jgi:intein-encoded DNA endonuclease-like protein
MDVIERLKKALPAGMVPNTYDLQVINKVYKIAAEKDLSWQPDFSSRQYSEAFVEWIADKLSKDKKFLKKTRRRFREIGVKRK